MNYFFIQNRTHEEALEIKLRALHFKNKNPNKLDFLPSPVSKVPFDRNLQQTDIFFQVWNFPLFVA